MGSNCREGQHWDDLVRDCMDCDLVCRQPQVDTSCTTYCESARCKALPGHYYDILLRKCMKCAVICGKHPPECSQHCLTPPSAMTTKKLLVLTSPHLEDSTIILYSLLAVCIVLLFSTLSLTLAVLLRGRKAQTSNPRPAEGANHRPKHVIQPRQELGFPGSQLGRSSKDIPTSPSCPTNLELADDSSPTETCVCIHCFPDLKTLGQGNDRPQRAPNSFYQPAVLHTAQIQKGGALWTEEILHSSGLEVQEEAAVG